MTIKDAIKKFMNRDTETIKDKVVKDNYLNSLRREKERINNKYEKERLKKEISNEYKKVGREELWGIKEKEIQKRSERLILRNAKQGMIKERKKIIKKKQKFEVKSQKFANKLSSNIRKLDIKTPKTKNIKYTEFRQHVKKKNDESILKAHNLFLKRKL